MSEHDEPKTALTRLLAEHRALSKLRVAADDAWIDCLCGERIAVDLSATGPYLDRAFSAHLADVLLAEGYTTSPAPDATETVELPDRLHSEQYDRLNAYVDALNRNDLLLPRMTLGDLVLDIVHEQIEAREAAIEAGTPLAAAEASTTVEWNVIRDGKPYLYPWLEHEDEAWDYVEDDEEVVKRTRTSYADRVTEWVPVDRAADEHEEDS